MKLTPSSDPKLIHFLEKLLDLCGELNCAALPMFYGHHRDVCLHDLEDVLMLLGETLELTDWSCVLERLERWEAVWQPLLIQVGTTGRPSRFLREARAEREARAS